MPTIRVAVTILLLSAMFWFIPFDHVAQTIVNAGLLEFIGAGGASMLVLCVASWRLRQLIIPFDYKLSTFEVLAINLKSIFYSIFLPGGNMSGAAVRLYNYTA